MMNKILLLFAITLFTSCSTDDKDCCVNIDTGVLIKYTNDDGENLFEIEGGFSLADINIYHKINNEWIRYNGGSLDSPRGIRKIEKENGTYLMVFPSTNIVENKYSETKIEFSETDSDILKTEINKSNSHEIVTKVWYNDVLKWEGNQSERIIEVVK